MRKGIYLVVISLIVLPILIGSLIGGNKRDEDSVPKGTYFQLSDEIKYEKEKANQYSKIKVKKTSGSYISINIGDIEDMDPYDIENEIEELKEQNDKLREILKSIDEDRIKRLDKNEFWETKNRY